MIQVFISYSRKNKDIAEQIENRLNNSYRDKFKLFRDEHHIRAGSDWEKTLEEEVKKCDVMLVIVTSEAKASEWVSKEIEEAKKRNKHVIPIQVNNTLLPKQLGHLQAIQLRYVLPNQENFADVILRITAAIEHKLSEKRNRIYLFILSFIVLILASIATYLIANQPQPPVTITIEPSRPPTTEQTETPSGNLIINGDFELGNITGQTIPEWVPDGAPNISISEEPHQGTYAVCTTQTDTNANWNGLHQVVEVTPNTTYEVSAWVKPENASEAQIKVSWLTSSNINHEINTVFVDTIPQTVTSNWQPFSSILSSAILQAPPNATHARIQILHGVLNGQGMDESTLCIDDVYFGMVE